MLFVVWVNEWMNECGSHVHTLVYMCRLFTALVLSVVSMTVYLYYQAKESFLGRESVYVKFDPLVQGTNLMLLCYMMSVQFRIWVFCWITKCYYINLQVVILPFVRPWLYLTLFDLLLFSPHIDFFENFIISTSVLLCELELKHYKFTFCQIWFILIDHRTADLSVSGLYFSFNIFGMWV